MPGSDGREVVPPGTNDVDELELVPPKATNADGVELVPPGRDIGITPFVIPCESREAGGDTESRN